MLHGRIVGDRYRLKEPLGSGGMSVVWRGEDDLLGREVAVKVMSAGVSADPAALKRMYAEARAAAGLRHDNVVEVFDYGEVDIEGVPMPYVVMELVDGRPLNDLLSAGALQWRLAVLIGAQVASALAAAHERGVVHRDVKPANVMVTSSGVKLVDFGISAAVGERELVADQILGTPAYLAPERLTGGLVRPATDVYALGLLLYMMLAGRLPWNASTTTQMLKAHRYREPAPLPRVPELPAEVTDLVRACLAKAPSDRPAAVTAARVLRKAAGLPPLSLLTGLHDRHAVDTPTEPVTAEATAGTVLGRRTVRERFTGMPARHRYVAAGVLVAALVTTGIIVWPTGPDRKPAAAPAVAAAPLACKVTYTTQIATAGRAATAVAVANTGDAPINGWTLSFHLPGEQRLVRGSGVTWKQSGEVVKASGRALGPGTTVKASFDTTYHGSVGLPPSFAVNDVVCGAQVAVRGAPSPAVSATHTSSGKAARPTSAGHRPPAKQPPAPAKGGPGHKKAHPPKPR